MKIACRYIKRRFTILLNIVPGDRMNRRGPTGTHTSGSRRRGSQTRNIRNRTDERLSGARSSVRHRDRTYRVTPTPSPTNGQGSGRQRLQPQYPNSRRRRPQSRMESERKSHRTTGDRYRPRPRPDSRSSRPEPIRERSRDRTSMSPSGRSHSSHTSHLTQSRLTHSGENPRSRPTSSRRLPYRPESRRHSTATSSHDPREPNTKRDHSRVDPRTRYTSREDSRRRTEMRTSETTFRRAHSRTHTRPSVAEDSRSSVRTHEEKGEHPLNYNRRTDSSRFDPRRPEHRTHTDIRHPVSERARVTSQHGRQTSHSTRTGSRSRYTPTGRDQMRESMPDNRRNLRKHMIHRTDTRTSTDNRPTSNRRYNQEKDASSRYEPRRSRGEDTRAKPWMPDRRMTHRTRPTSKYSRYTPRPTQDSRGSSRGSQTNTRWDSSNHRRHPDRRGRERMEPYTDPRISRGSNIKRSENTRDSSVGSVSRSSQPRGNSRKAEPDTGMYTSNRRRRPTGVSTNQRTNHRRRYHSTRPTRDGVYTHPRDPRRTRQPYTNTRREKPMRPGQRITQPRQIRREFMTSDGSKRMYEYDRATRTWKPIKDQDNVLTGRRFYNVGRRRRPEAKLAPSTVKQRDTRLSSRERMRSTSQSKKLAMSSYVLPEDSRYAYRYGRSAFHHLRSQ